MFDFSEDQLAVINLALSEAHYNYSVELDKIKKNKSMLFGEIGNHPERKKELKRLIVIIDSIEEYLRKQ
jgi:hypothetical protein